MIAVPPATMQFVKKWMWRLAPLVLVMAMAQAWWHLVYRRSDPPPPAPPTMAELDAGLTADAVELRLRAIAASGEAWRAGRLSEPVKNRLEALALADADAAVRAAASAVAIDGFEADGRDAHARRLRELSAAQEP